MLPSPTPAAGGTRFRTLLLTRHPHEALGFLAGLQYNQHTLEFKHGAKPDIRLNGFTLDRLSVCSIEYGLPAIAWVETRSNAWMFSELLRGEVGLGTGEVYRAGIGAVYGPENTQEIRMSGDAQLLNLRVDRFDMENACRSLLGSDLLHPLRFTDLTPAGSPHLLDLRRIIKRLAETPHFPHPAAARLERTLQEASLFELLLSWPNSYAGHLDNHAALPRSTRRARDYIQAHAADLPTLGEIAAAAGVGARALTLSFRKHLNVSPMRYLMQCRLDGVRSALLRRQDSVTVTTTAFEWGFFNLGEFAQHYRERFGELPSQTLRMTVAGG